jgi:hypothetical protein
MIPAEVKAAAATLGTWCLEEAKRLRGALNPTNSKVVLFYELVGSVCDYFLKVLGC